MREVPSTTDDREPRAQRGPDRQSRWHVARRVGVAAAVIGALALATVAARSAPLTATAVDLPTATEAAPGHAGDLPSAPMPTPTLVGQHALVDIAEQQTLVCPPDLEEAPDAVKRQMIKSKVATRVDGQLCLVLPRPRTVVPTAQCIEHLRWSCVVP